MSNPEDPGSGRPSGEEEADAWTASLMRRTEEVGHIQAQTAPMPDTRANPHLEPGHPAHAVPMRGAPAPGPVAVKGPPGTTPASPRKVMVAPPPPPPTRPLASVLALGSGACALLAAVLLVLPELRQVGLLPQEAPGAREETMLAPRFDTSAPVPEGQVREQQDTLRGASVLMLESEPPGATVTVDGVKQGTTPLSLTPLCNPGNPVRVKFVRKGFESLEHATVCREDAMTKLTARLRKARGGR